MKIQVDFVSSNKPTNSSQLSKTLNNVPISMNIPDYLKINNNIENVFLGGYWKGFGAIMTRTGELSSYTSVPRTAFFMENETTDYRDISKRIFADRYIGLSKTDPVEDNIQITVRDVYGIEEPEFKLLKVKGKEEALKTFDFVTRWPMSISLLDENTLDSSFFKTFQDNFSRDLSTLNASQTSVVVIKNAPVFTYEKKPPSVFQISDIEEFVNELGGDPEAYGKDRRINSQLYGNFEIEPNDFYSHLCF